MNKIYYFGKTNFRHKKRFGIKRGDLPMHFLLLGDGWTAKNEILHLLALQALQDMPVFVLDFSGELSRKLEASLEKETIVNLHQSAASSLSSMLKIKTKDLQRTAQNIFKALQKNFDLQMSEKMRDIFLLSLKTSLLLPDSDFHTPFLLISDNRYRTLKLQEIQNEDILNYWSQEFENIELYSKKILADDIKLVYSNMLSRDEKYEKQKPFDLQKDLKRCVFLIDFVRYENDLDFGMTSESLLLQSYNNLDKKDPEKFLLLLSDFKGSLPDYFKDLLVKSKARQNSVLLSAETLSFDKEMLSQFGSFASFALSEASTVDYSYSRLALQSDKEDLLRLGKRNFYLRLIIDGTLSYAFSAETLLQNELPELDLPLRKKKKEKSEKNYDKIKIWKILPGAKEF